MLWLGTAGSGLGRFCKGEFARLEGPEQFPDNYITSIAEDAEGCLWIGTVASGLVRLKDRRVWNWIPDSPLLDNVITTLLEARPGEIWAGTRSQGLIHFKENKVVRVYTTRDGLSSNRIRTLNREAAGTLWIGTADGGLNAWQTGNIVRFNKQSGLADNRITALCHSANGPAKTLWIGTAMGLNALTNGRFLFFGPEAGLPARDILSLLDDREGNLWIGTSAGLGLYRSGQFNIRDLGTGAPTPEIETIYADRYGTIWLGTNGLGLVRIEQKRITICGSAQGLISDHVSAIQEDDQGHIWIGTENGVARVARQEFDRLAEKSLARISSLTFDESDGMASRQCTTGGQPSVWGLSDGRLLFATMRGIAVFDPNKIAINTRPPPVEIEDLIADNLSVINRPKISLPADTQLVEIYFTALSLVSPRKIGFKYKLEGLDREWKFMEPGRRRTAVYINLAPGSYCFRVTACNNDGIWNPVGASLRFAVGPRSGRNLALYLRMATGAVLIVVALIGWRRFQRRQKKEKYRSSALSDQKAEQVYGQLLQLMEKERIFLDEGLNLQLLAGRLGVHPNHLSRIINERGQSNFNDFINRYRIAEVKKRLLESETEEPNILEIAFDCGFNSKSVFNTTFKKFTGLTPTRFRRLHTDQDQDRTES